MFIRTAYNYDMAAASDESGLACLDESRAKQSFKDECDINTIVRRFGVTGQVPASVAVPLNGDFVGAIDFRQSMDLIIAARASFMEMSSNVRNRFHNDPAEFLDFVSDKDNMAEARKMGLLIPEAPKPVPPDPILVRMAPEPS